MSEIKLLPCPFCGEVEKVELVKCNGSWSVLCVRCASSSNCYEKPQQAIKKWNTRKPLKRIVKRLEEEKSDWNDDYNVPLNNAIQIVKEEGGIE